MSVPRPLEVSSLSPRQNSAGVYELLIDGSWYVSKSETLYDNVDPAQPSTVHGRVSECTPEEIQAALAAAERDFDLWRSTTGEFRTKVFYRLTELLKQSQEYFVETMTREMGKSLYDSYLDYIEAVGVAEALAPQGANLKGVTYPKLTPGLTMESRLAPRGVAAIITPFNFPLAIPLAQIVAALITGNPVIWKPSHLTPETSQALAVLVENALATEGTRYGVTVPRGAFQCLTGDSATGDALIRAPVVQTISFTGSKAVGDHVDSVASALGKRVMKEVAGINFFYVHRDANLERAVNNFIYGKTITAGQRCSSIQEVLCDDIIYDEFLERSIAAAPRVVYGPGASDAVSAADRSPEAWSCTPLASAEQLARLRKLVDAAVAAGAKIAFQGTLPPELPSDAYFYPLTVLTDVDSSNPLYREEAFGPVAVVSRIAGVDEAIERINSKIGIVACIDSENKSATERFIDRVLRTRIDDGRHGTGCFWGTKFGGDRGAGSGNPALDEDMVLGYCIWKTIYRAYDDAR